MIYATSNKKYLNHDTMKKVYKGFVYDGSSQDWFERYLDQYHDWGCDDYCFWHEPRKGVDYEDVTLVIENDIQTYIDDIAYLDELDNYGIEYQTLDELSIS